MDENLLGLRSFRTVALPSTNHLQLHLSLWHWEKLSKTDTLSAFFCHLPGDTFGKTLKFLQSCSLQIFSMYLFFVQVTSNNSCDRQLFLLIKIFFNFRTIQYSCSWTANRVISSFKNNNSLPQFHSHSCCKLRLLYLCCHLLESTLKKITGASWVLMLYRGKSHIFLKLFRILLEFRTWMSRTPRSLLIHFNLLFYRESISIKIHWNSDWKNSIILILWGNQHS